MSKNRWTAWLRPALILLALAGMLSLAGCGGGNGAPNNPYQSGNSATPLAVLPPTLTVYSGVPATLNISGGSTPYTIVSSDQSVLPVVYAVSDSAVTLNANNVSADTPVTLTVRDSKGASATTTVTVKAGALVNALTLRADNFSNASCPSSSGLSLRPTETSTTWLCSGQTGSLAVRLNSSPGGGIAGKQVRFDIVQGDFQIFVNGPGQPEAFALTYTVPTDQNGDAVVRVRANPAAHQQVVIVQATDVASGTFVRGVFVIQQVGVITSTQLEIVPTTVTITGPDTQTCSSGVSASFFVFGGQPPYTVTNPFPQALALFPNVVTSSGSGFTVTTTGACVDPATFPVTDAAGHTTTVDLHNVFGTTPPATVTTNIPIVAAPLPVPTLTCAANTYGLTATGGGTITTQGNQQTTKPATSYVVSTNRPDILTILPSNPAPGAQITLTRASPAAPATSVVDPSQPNGAVVNLTVQISDGNQSLAVTVPVTNRCP